LAFDPDCKTFIELDKAKQRAIYRPSPIRLAETRKLIGFPDFEFIKAKSGNGAQLLHPSVRAI